ncbi:epimerase [Gammaproteobacteria bacterium 53_120_T64]|nr:epimerase [Gammaproteobacteria bacterium 53_120_T64]
MSTYLVTGGCGFIGSHLVRSLVSDGHRVRVLDDLSTGKKRNLPPHCELVVGDVTEMSLVRDCMVDADACFHLAAIASVQQGNEQWLRCHNVNQTGSINVFEVCREKKKPVVYASSAAVYGDNAELPLRENTGLRPVTSYGADKLGSELHAQVASLIHEVPTTGLRFFNVYGPRQNPHSPYSGVISIFVDSVLEKQGLTIYGDGEQTRDFIYVADVVNFLRQAMKNIGRMPRVFNVCRGSAVSINQLAKTIMSLSDTRVAINYQPSRKGDIRVSIGDPAAARQYLSVTAKTPLSKGLRLLLKYNFEKYQSQQYLFSSKMIHQY